MKKKELVVSGILYVTAAILIGISTGINLSKHFKIINCDYFRIPGIILLIIIIILFGKKYQNLLKTLK